jgi:hypothetical protein
MSEVPELILLNLNPDILQFAPDEVINAAAEFIIVDASPAPIRLIVFPSGIVTSPVHVYSPAAKLIVSPLVAPDIQEFTSV